MASFTASLCAEVSDPSFALTWIVLYPSRYIEMSRLTIESVLFFGETSIMASNFPAAIFPPAA